MKKILLIFLATFLCSSLFSQNSELTDYTIYSKIINQFNEECIQKWQKKGTKKILINKTSEFKNTFKDSEYYPDNIQYGCMSCHTDTLLVNLIMKLDTVNNSQINFTNLFQLKKYKPLLIDKEEFSSFFDNDSENGWKNFYEKYPKALGFMTVTKIAYSEDKKVGIIYIDILYNSLGAVGFILLFDTSDYFLIKKEKIWQS